MDKYHTKHIKNPGDDDGDDDMDRIVEHQYTELQIAASQQVFSVWLGQLYDIQLQIMLIT